MSSEPAIAVEAATFGYGPEAVVHEVSVTVARGEFVGIIGPNGSGKSTLLKLMSGYLRPRGGHVTVDGAAVAGLSRAALGRVLALVPQDTAVTMPFTVMEMVLLGRTPHGSGFAFEDERDLAAARQAMERTDTLSLASRRITELSGGERQRVILARALAQEPRILLLDEPAAFLDIRHAVELYDLLADLLKEGKSVLTVLHDLNLAAMYCDRVGLLKSGRLLQLGPPAEVITYANITATYDTEVYVDTNDVTGAVNVLPLSRVYRERLRRKH